MPTPNPEKPMLTVAEVADRLSLSRSGVYKLVAEGVIPAMHIGKSIRIPADQFESWLGARTPEVAP